MIDGLRVTRIRNAAVDVGCGKRGKDCKEEEERRKKKKPAFFGPPPKRRTPIRP
jgi:hypothetical protein